MPTKTVQTLLIAIACIGLLLAPCSAYATDINFEGISDSFLIEHMYAAQGVRFANAISLTAGFSLNEIDYPPHSGVMVVGDTGAPMEMSFFSPVSAWSAWFTWSAPLTIDVYSDPYFTNLLGSIITTGSNLGFSQQVGLICLSNLTFQSIQILDSAPGSQGMIMDDLSFTPAGTQPPIPEPSTLVLLGTACAAALSRIHRRWRRRSV